MTVHQLLASLREAYRSIVIVEYDDGIFTSLGGEDRDVIFAVGRTPREATVLLWAPRGDRGLRALLGTADLVVWHYDDRPARSTIRPRGRRPVQTTFAEAGWAGSS